MPLRSVVLASRHPKIFNNRGIENENKKVRVSFGKLEISTVPTSFQSGGLNALVSSSSWGARWLPQHNSSLNCLLHIVQGFLPYSEVVRQPWAVTGLHSRRLVCYEMVPQGDCGIVTLLLYGEAGQLEGDMNALTDQWGFTANCLRESLENGIMRMDG